MRLYYYQGSKPNFGDELNHVLLPRVFPGLFDQQDDRLFLGIGSILNDQHPARDLKVVFGSGYGGYAPAPIIDESWRIYGVRGEFTADALSISRRLVVGDAALLVNAWFGDPVPKRHKVSLIPHFESLDRGSWKAVADDAGFHFIDPTGDTLHVLEDIKASELIVAEAMHGAIVADALRVPWIALEPQDARHHMKWADWGSAIGIRPDFLPMRPTSLYEAMGVNTVSLPRRAVRKGYRRIPGHGRVDAWFARKASDYLARRIERVDPQLSTDAALAEAVEKLQHAAERIRADFPV
ncbi:polysaccharide pyruvyl transferase family protein [Chthonobacter albigriseus]|uniref:polysaccharide pyruvyl transferase family protein n=1 Tax=Chthonobacter albigriseus TaxID=1683161 RepID=UPI0015EFB4F0|nr:polysaccharide pyruvyl transferase family protein [Chthonobacter albigriseus]